MLVRDGVDLSPPEGEPPVTLLEASYAKPGVAESSVAGRIDRFGRIDVRVNNNAPNPIGKPSHEIEVRTQLPGPTEGALPPDR